MTYNSVLFLRRTEETETHVGRLHASLFSMSQWQVLSAFVTALIVSKAQSLTDTGLTDVAQPIAHHAAYDPDSLLFSFCTFTSIHDRRLRLL